MQQRLFRQQQCALQETKEEGAWQALLLSACHTGPSARRPCLTSIHAAAGAGPTCVRPALVRIPGPAPRVIIMVAVPVMWAVPPRRPPLIAQHWELLLRRQLHLGQGQAKGGQVLLASRTAGCLLRQASAAVPAGLGCEGNKLACVPLLLLPRPLLHGANPPASCAPLAALRRPRQGQAVPGWHAPAAWRRHHRWARRRHSRTPTRSSC